jgi:hypothetical protein
LAPDLYLVEMLLVACPILHAHAIGFGLLDADAGGEAAPAFAGVAAAAGAGRGDVLPVLVLLETLGRLSPRGGRAGAAAAASGHGRKVSLGLGIVVDLGTGEVRGQIPAESQGGEALVRRGVAGIRVWIHGQAQAGWSALCDEGER